MTQLDLSLVGEWNFVNKNVPLQNAITQNDLSKLCKNWKTYSANDFLFNHVIDKEPKVSNQKSSGRCWMFAGLNVLRINFIKKFRLNKNFEFSQTHLFFYDKLERANTFLEKIIKTRSSSINDRYVQQILKSPLCDGGYWHTFVNLVDKYGLVPKSVYPETYHSGNTSKMNFVLGYQLRQFADEMRKTKVEDLTKLKNDFLKEYHRLLTLFLGTPVSNFDWKYYDKDDKYEVKNGLTPKEFYRLGEIDVKDFVTLTNDPRNKYEKKMKIDYVGNMEGTSNIVYYNTTINELEKWAKESVLRGIPVWYGCDVKKWMDLEKDAMDLDLVDYEILGVDFKLGKRKRMEYGISCPTHAMTIVGFESNDINDNIGEIRKWKVENSWDSKGVNDGYYTMTHKWFKQYVYEVVIPRNILDEEMRKKIDECKDVIDLPPWDIMFREKK